MRETSTWVGRARLEARLRDAAQAVAGGVPHALLAVRLDRARDAVRLCGAPVETMLSEFLCAVVADQIGPAVVASRLDIDRVALLKPRCLPRDAATLAHRLRWALGGAILRWHGRAFRLGVTVGVAEVDADPERAVGQLAAALESSATASALGGDGVLLAAGGPSERAELERELDWRRHVSETLG